MAVQTATTADSITTTATPVTGYPFTMTSVAKWSVLTGVAAPVLIRDSGLTNYTRLNFDGATAGDPVVFMATSGTFRTANSTAAYSNTDWNYIAGVGTNASSRTVYLNGGNNATNTATVTPSGWDRMVLADTSNTGTGQTSEVAIWDVALTAAEVQSLAKGFKAYRIRPQSLVFYAPLVRDLVDIKGAIALTNSGTTVVAHPRVY